MKSPTVETDIFSATIFGVNRVDNDKCQNEVVSRRVAQSGLFIHANE